MGILHSLRRPAVHRVAVLCVVAAAAAWVFAFKATRRMPDFEVYWGAGRRAANAEPLYRASDDQYQFKYFPAFAVLAMPVGALPLRAAKPVWFGSAVGALIGLLWLTLQSLPERRKPGWVIVLALIVGLGKYYGQELVLGQINLFFTFVVVCAMLAFARGRQLLGGLLVALAIVIKPYGLILLPWLATRTQMRALSAAVAGVGAAFLAPAAMYGFAGTVSLHRAWWAVVKDTTVGTLNAPDNVSLAAMYTRWLGATPAAAWCAGVTALALLATAALVIVRRRGVARPDGLEMALLVTLTPLLSPQGWGYVVVVSTPALAYLVNYADSLPRPLRWLTFIAIGTIGLTLFDLLGRRFYYVLVYLAITTLCFFVVVASLVVLRLRKTA